MCLREGPVPLAARLGIAPSTVHRILTSARLNRLSHIDRATGEPIRRYEHPHPGSLIHVIDDHSRIAYAEIRDDETATTATGVLHRAVQWLADRGVTVERVLSNNLLQESAFEAA
jgi:hypothetical protein